ncbi:MAG: hypothetical protein JXQ96_22365 [Cyclobacteriaceae bacterium]
MKIFDFVKALIASGSTKQISPEGYCPNCWGRQEYGGQFFESIKTEGINTNNIEEKKGWIQAYAEKHLTGIQLNVNDAQLVCNNCHVNYENNK